MGIIVKMNKLDYDVENTILREDFKSQMSTEYHTIKGKVHYPFILRSGGLIFI